MGADLTLLIVQGQLAGAERRITELESKQKQLESKVQEQKRIIGELTRELGNTMRPNETDTTI